MSVPYHPSMDAITSENNDPQPSTSQQTASSDQTATKRKTTANAQDINSSAKHNKEHHKHTDTDKWH